MSYDWVVWLSYAMVVLMFAMFILMLIQMFRKRAPLDEYRDVLKKIRKQHIQSARMNRIKGIKKVVCTGDRHHPPVILGKYYGSISDERMTEIFVGRVRKKWILVPNELIHDFFSRDLTIECRGVMKYAGILYIPILTEKYKARHDEIVKKIDDYINWVTHVDLQFELTQQMYFSTLAAANAPPSRPELWREEYPPKIEEKEGGE